MAVTTIINNSNARADAAIVDAQSYLDELGEIAREDQLNLFGNWALTPWLSELYDNIGIAEPTEVSYVEPETEDLTEFQTPVVPVISGPTLPDLWTDDTIPEFTEVAPDLDIPNKPNLPIPTSPPIYQVQDIAILDWLETTFPDRPSLDESPLPAPDVLNVMAVDMTLPVHALTSPENTFSFVETEYSSDLLDSLDDLLKNDILNGSYGIEPLDEQLLFERARDREVRQANVNVRQIRERIAARKFPVPPGFLYEAEQQEVQRGASALSELNREILLQRSERFVQARQFAVQQGLNLEQALLNYTSSKEDRALKAAEATASFAIQFHNTAVALFQLDIELRRLYRDLHAEHLQTVLAKVEEYRMKLQHIEAEDNRNKTRVILYGQLLAAVKLFYDAQAARDERTKVELQIETMKLEQSKLDVDLYLAQIRARRETFDAYATEIQGESLKLDLFSSQISAHQEQVDTVTKTSDLKRAQFEAELKNLMERRLYLSLQLQRTETELKTVVAETNAFATSNEENINIWRFGLDTQQFNSRIGYERNVEVVNKYLTATKVNIDNLATSMGVINNYNELKAVAAKSAIGLYENQIAGAEGALSAVASLAEAAG
jgi:hypothetical protein